MADLSPTVFVQSTNEAFKRTNTHTHKHTHTHIHTNTHTHTHRHSDEYNISVCCIGLKVLCTYQCIRFEFFTLKMIIKDVEELDDSWQVNVPCQRAYVFKNWSNRLFAVHNRTFHEGRTHERTNELTNITWPAGIRRSTVCERCKKWHKW